MKYAVMMRILAEEDIEVGGPTVLARTTLLFGYISEKKIEQSDN